MPRTTPTFACVVVMTLVAAIVLAPNVIAGTYSGRVFTDVPLTTASLPCDGRLDSPPWCRLGFQGGDTVFVKLAAGEAGAAYVASIASPAHAEAELCWTNAPGLFKPSTARRCHVLTGGDVEDAFLCGCEVGDEGLVPSWATAFTFEVFLGADVRWTVDIAGP